MDNTQQKQNLQDSSYQLTKERSPSFNTETIYSQQNYSSTKDLHQSRHNNSFNISQSQLQFQSQNQQQQQSQQQSLNSQQDQFSHFEKQLQKLSVGDLMNNIQNSPSQETRSTCENQIISLLTQQHQNSQSNEYLSYMGNQSIFPVQCKIHPQEEIHFCCYSCENQVLCIECVTQGVHQLHEVKNIKAAQNDIIDTIQNTLKNIQKTIENQNQENEQIINKKNETIEQISELKNSIDIQFQDILQQVQNKQKFLQVKCQELLEQSLVGYEQAIQKKKRKMKVFLDSHKIIENSYNNLNSTDLFYYYIDKQSVLKELLKYDASLQDTEITNQLSYLDTVQNINLNLNFSLKNLSSCIEQIDISQSIKKQQQQNQLLLGQNNQNNQNNSISQKNPISIDFEQGVQQIQQTRKLQMQFNSQYLSTPVSQRNLSQQKFETNTNNNINNTIMNINNSLLQRDHSFEKLAQEIEKDRNKHRNDVFKSQLQKQCDRSFKYSQSPKGNQEKFLHSSKHSILGKKQSIQEQNLSDLQEFYVKKNPQKIVKDFRNHSPSLQNLQDLQNFLNTGKIVHSKKQQQKQHRQSRSGYLIQQQNGNGVFSQQSSPIRNLQQQRQQSNIQNISSIKKEGQQKQQIDQYSFNNLNNIVGVQVEGGQNNQEKQLSNNEEVDIKMQLQKYRQLLQNQKNKQQQQSVQQ